MNGRKIMLSDVLRCCLLSLLLLAMLGSVRATPLNLSNIPLFIGVGDNPNVFMMMDDSGAMDWEILVDAHYHHQSYWNDLPRPIYDTGRWSSSAELGPCPGRRDFAYLYDNLDNAWDSCDYPVTESHVEALQRDWRVRSSQFNRLYYNPEVEYRPWAGMPPADFSAVRSNPWPGTSGYGQVRDLAGFVFEVAIDDKGFVDDAPAGPASIMDGGNGLVDLWDSRIRFAVQGTDVQRVALTTAPASTIRDAEVDCDLESLLEEEVPYAHCFGTVATLSVISGETIDEYGRTVVETQQNIANWYQYHRRRAFVGKAAVAELVQSSSAFRLGLSVINQPEQLFVPVPSEETESFAAHNEMLLSAFMTYEWPRLDKPLRRGLELVGRYYEGLDGRADPITSACQQNFSVLFSDGNWNGPEPLSGIGDVDGDGRSATLADVAAYFYQRDLRPNLPNQVPTTSFNPASHQHMVTVAAAFGATGRLVDTDGSGWPNPPLTESSNWGNPFNSRAERVDDMWHAAYNSRGRFINAQRPDVLVDALREAVFSVTEQRSSAAAVAANAGTLSEDGVVYQARFDSADWSGQLLAYQIGPTGELGSSPLWNAASVLDGQNPDTGRSILTYKPLAAGGGRGLRFRWPSDYRNPDSAQDFSSAQINNLLQMAPFPAATTDEAGISLNQAYGQALVDYLRGRRADEGSGNEFRERGSVLGDIINSDPRYVGAPRMRYADNLAARPYSVFQQRYANRSPMIYVGANDGMLHGFDAQTGAERLAYVPHALFSSLPLLSDPDYNHRYYVDGGINVVDAYLPGISDPNSSGSGAWRSVLVGTLGAGGQAVYALDVTDPANFSEANASNLVLWEFSDANDADLGNVFGRAQIARMANGRWAAIFGNGYNSTESDNHVSSNGHAALFIVDLENGSLIRKITTQQGSLQSANGLSTPVLIDADGNNSVDFIYAGDLSGRLWKFDVRSSNPGQWAVAHRQGNTPRPLFITQSGQPITTQPQVTRHPDGSSGFMVYFGTGKYLEVGDNSASGQATQAFYGIWDNNNHSQHSLTSSSLLSQQITEQYVQSFDTNQDGVDDMNYLLREVSDNGINFSSHRGWKLDLMPQQIAGSSNSNNFGERQVGNALIRDGRVIFTTLMPSQDPCAFGGSSFIMQLDYRNGGRLRYPAFDLNRDGFFDSADTLASGRMTDIGIVSTLSVLVGDGADFAIASGSSGEVDVIELNRGVTAAGRQSWRQLE